MILFFLIEDLCNIFLGKQKDSNIGKMVLDWAWQVSLILVGMQSVVVQGVGFLLLV